MVLLGKSRKMASPLIASAHLLPDAKLWWLFLNCTIKGLDFTLLPLTDHRARTGAPRCWWQRHDCSLVLCLCKCLVRSRTKAGLVVMTGLWCLFRFEFTCTVCCFFFFFLEWKWLFIWAKKHLILYIFIEDKETICQPVTTAKQTFCCSNKCNSKNLKSQPCVVWFTYGVEQEPNSVIQCFIQVSVAINK